MMRRWFGKRGARPPLGTRPPDRNRLALDLLTRDWQCACCGEWHHGIMDLAAKAPDPWPHPRDHEPNAALRTDGDFLSQDFCVLGGEDFFVRSIMKIPVHGLERTWAWGCWNSLSRANFDAYVERFDEGFVADEGPWFGWLANSLRIYSEDPQPIAVDVHPQPGRQRPRLVVQDENHPLARAQREGISPDDLLSLLRAYGHGPSEH
jgi:hypothetical protein